MTEFAMEQLKSLAEIPEIEKPADPVDRKAALSQTITREDAEIQRDVLRKSILYLTICEEDVSMIEGCVASYVIKILIKQNHSSVYRCQINARQITAQGAQQTTDTNHRHAVA